MAEMLPGPTTSEQAYRKPHEEGPAPEEPSVAGPGAKDPRVRMHAGLITALLQQLQTVDRTLERARLNARPVDLTPLFVANQKLIMQSLAFLLDEMLPLSGEQRSISYRDTNEGRNGSH